MARGSKLSETQRDILFTLSRTGVIAQSNIKDLGFRPSSINKMVDLGLIKQVEILHHKTQVETCYRLTSAGSKRCSRYFNNNYCSRNSRHDLELNNQYSRLTKEQRDNWLTEGEIRDFVRSKIQDLEDYGQKTYYLNMLDNKELSMPDGGFFNPTTQTIEFIEIITNNYGQADIQAKQQTIEFLGGTCNFIKV